MFVSKRFPLASWSRPRRSLVAADGAGRRFAPGLWPTVLTLLGVAILIALGTWQVERLHWKEALIAERAAQLAAPAEPLPAQRDGLASVGFPSGRRSRASSVTIWSSCSAPARDRWPGRPSCADPAGAARRRRRPGRSRLGAGRPGAPGDAARGRSSPGPVEVPASPATAARTGPAGSPPTTSPAQGLWYWYDLPALERALGLELLPVVVEADATPNPGGLPIGGQTLLELPNNHLQYAITWYGLAAGAGRRLIGFGLTRGGTMRALRLTAPAPGRLR